MINKNNKKYVLSFLDKKNVKNLIEDLGNPEAKELYLALSFKYDDYKKYLRAIQ
jgi:hypothetical protein